MKLSTATGTVFGPSGTGRRGGWVSLPDAVAKRFETASWQRRQALGNDPERLQFNVSFGL